MLRDQFVELYSKPILEDLYDSLHYRFPEQNFEDVPERGDLDLNVVRESFYFFD
jgi:DNA-directed RNA polymerase